MIWQWRWVEDQEINMQSVKISLHSSNPRYFLNKLYLWEFRPNTHESNLLANLRKGMCICGTVSEPHWCSAVDCRTAALTEAARHHPSDELFWRRRRGQHQQQFQQPPQPACPMHSQTDSSTPRYQSLQITMLISLYQQEACSHQCPTPTHNISILTAIFQVDLGWPVPECLHSELHWS